MTVTIDNLKQEVFTEFHNILNYWLKYSIDHKNGGFYGVVNHENIPNLEADKGIVLNSRILWTFSRAYLEEKNPEYLAMSKMAFEYIKKYFWD